MCGCYIRCYVLSVISGAWVHAYINVQHSCTRRAGCADRKDRALRANIYTRFQF